jgi:hypothetical protein
MPKKTHIVNAASYTYVYSFVGNNVISLEQHNHIEIHKVRCNENPIYVFLFWELRGLRPNFHIHVSVSDLYISRIGPHIFL